MDGKIKHFFIDVSQDGDQSKAALYKTILASYSKNSINSNPLLHSISRDKGSANGLNSRTSQKRRLRKSKRSKREFQRRSIIVAVVIITTTTRKDVAHETLQDLVIAMFLPGGSGDPAG